MLVVLEFSNSILDLYIYIYICVYIYIYIYISLYVLEINSRIFVDKTMILGSDLKYPVEW